MKLSTKNSLAGRIADHIGLNKKFHQYEKIGIDPNDSALISPVEGKKENKILFIVNYEY